MKLIQTILIIFIAAIARAADPATYTYHGEVAGVVCSACASKVKAAIGKLDGVQSVTITLGDDKAALPRLEVVSTSPSLTKEAAVKALGEAAKTYDIRSLKRDAK